MNIVFNRPLFAESDHVPQIPLCTSSDPIDAAACLVKKQALWALASKVMLDHHLSQDNFLSVMASVSRNIDAGGNLKQQYRRIVAFSAMDYVQARVSTASYGFESTEAGFAAPATPDEALRRKIGICGNQVAVFEAVLEKLKVPVRHVQLWYIDAAGNRANHILAEVRWGGGWHLFDITWGAYYPSSLSTESRPDPLPLAVVLSDKPRAVYNPNDPATRFVFAAGGDPFAYLRGKNLSYTIADVGEVIVEPDMHRGTALIERFNAIPNFVGFNRPQARSGGGTSFLFRGVVGRFDVSINVAAYAGCHDSELVLNKATAAPKVGVILFRKVLDPAQLSVSRSDDEACYLVMRSVEFLPVDTAFKEGARP